MIRYSILYLYLDSQRKVVALCMLYASSIVKPSLWPFGSLACRIGVVWGLHTAKLNAKRALAFSLKAKRALCFWLWNAMQVEALAFLGTCYFARAGPIFHKVFLAGRKVMAKLPLHGNLWDAKRALCLLNVFVEKWNDAKKWWYCWRPLYNCKPPGCWRYHLRLLFLKLQSASGLLHYAQSFIGAHSPNSQTRNRWEEILSLTPQRCNFAVKTYLETDLPVLLA